MYNGRAAYFQSGRATAEAEASIYRFQNLQLMKEKEKLEKALKKLGPRLRCGTCNKEIIVLKEGIGIDTFCCGYKMKIIDK